MGSCHWQTLCHFILVTCELNTNRLLHCTQTDMGDSFHGHTQFKKILTGHLTLSSLVAPKYQFPEYQPLTCQCLTEGIRFVLFSFRECASSNHNYLLNNQRYCRGSCAAQTRCGPVAIPENHLKVRTEEHGTDLL